MKRWLLVLCLTMMVGLNADISCAIAQGERADSSISAAERPEMETDRDAFTPANSTVGKNLTIFETSYSFIDNKDVADTHSLPETLVRFGLSDRIEFRLGWNFEVGGAGDTVSGSEGSEGFEGRIERESTMLYGIKASVTEQDGWIPRSAFILQGYTPPAARLPPPM